MYPHRETLSSAGRPTTLGYTSAVPTYEYECTACGQHIEVFQRFSEDALTTCGVCGGPLRKVFHPTGHRVQGVGLLLHGLPLVEVLRLEEGRRGFER